MTAMASPFSGLEERSGDPRFFMGLLGGIAALMLVTATAEMQHSSGATLSGFQLPIFDNVSEMRPQGPPPVFDVDQMSPEEVEQVAPTPYSANIDGSGRDGGNARARPEM
ncbi:hypothetical protein M0534_00285 [Methylonatrum kenyense]|uniref:hypothetical protein n=1 Tax=Methylonatrum kenyense TaxID=455253 RepID=UPI0020BE0513|nr:hypothetical protein [Methylonatrum kenyense]MCK8514769.1 hypothetical protein [Methylonatrum kenyense]